MKRWVVAVVVGFLAVGAAASYRAYWPVFRLELHVTPVVAAGAEVQPVVAVGDEVQVEVVSSGRGPVAIRLEATQGTQVKTLARARISSRRWAFWDPRPIRRVYPFRFMPEALASFETGPAVLRVTATGAPAWLRQPPPVVREVPVRIQVTHETVTRQPMEQPWR